MSPVVTASAAPPQGVEVPLGDVERELSRQLRTMHGAGEGPVRRVRMSNLIVFTDRPDELDDLSARLSDVALVHPARVQLLVGNAPVEQLTAAVRVQAHRLGSRDQATTELIILKAPPGAADRLPFAVRSLLVGDLPINIWWASRTPPPFAGPVLAETAEHAQQVMYDSLGWADPARGVAATADWVAATERFEPGRWRVVSDLNWRRLKYWRRFAAQALQGTESRGLEEVLGEVQVEHGPHAVVQAWLLVGWVARRLGWKVQAGRTERGVEMAWTFRTARADVTVRVRRLDAGPSEVRRVRVVGTVAGQSVAMSLALDAPNRLRQTVEGADAEPRTLTVPPLTPAEVVGRQLSDRERDAAFRDSLATAQVMARSLVG